MPVQRLLNFVEAAVRVHMQVRWKGLPTTEKPLEPFVKVSEDVLAMLKRFLARKNIDPDVLRKSRQTRTL